MLHIIIFFLVFVQCSCVYANSKDIVVSPSTGGKTDDQYAGLISKIQEHLKQQNTNFITKELPKPATDKNNSEKIGISAHVECSTENSLAKITIRFSEQAPLAIFRQDNDWYIFIAYPTITEIPPLNYDKIPDITDITAIDIDKGHIIKVELNRHLNPEVKQISKELTLVFKPNLNIEDNGSLLIQAPTNIKDPFQLHIPRKTTTLEYVDETTQRHFVILCSGEKTKSVSQYSYPEFVMLESIQGFAFELLSDTLSYEATRKVFKLSKPDGIAVSPARTMEPLVDNISVFADFDAATASQMIDTLMSSTFKKSKDLISNNIQLSWYYLGLGKIPEAIAIINRLKESNPDIILIPTFSALDGLAQLLANRPEKAVNSLQPLSYDTEPLFWGLIAKASKNVFMDTEQFYQLANYKDKLILLPQPLKNRLLVNILLIACLQKNYDVLKTYINEKILTTNTEVTAVMKLGQALLDLNNEQRELAKTSLQELTTLEWHPKVQAIASLVLLHDFEQKEGAEESKNLISALEELRFNWRGDLLEYQVTQYLIEVLIADKRYPLALSVLRKLIRYFPEQSLNDELPQIMQQQLLTYFKQEPQPPFLEALSVFQEFGDIAPNNVEGDKIMMDTTQQLVRVGLANEAVSILNDYLDTKLRYGEDLSERRSRIQLQIISYLKEDKKYDLALNNITALNSIPENLIDDTHIMKAEILQKLGKSQEALDVLQQTPKQQLKKGTLHFNQKQWPQASKCYETALSEAQTLTPEQYDMAVVNLAICYSLLQQPTELKSLIEKSDGKVTGDKNKNILKILQLSPTPQQQASEYFTQIDELTDTLKKTFTS